MATLSVLSYNPSPGLVKLKVNSGSGGSGGNTPTGTAISSGISLGTTSNSGSGVNLSKTFSKITVNSVLSESNGNTLNISNNSGSNSHVNAIVRKIKDFGMSGSVNGASGKNNSIRAGALTVIARKRPLVEVKAQAENKLLLQVSKKCKPAKDMIPATIKPVKKCSEPVQRLKLQALSGVPRSPGVAPTNKPPGTPGRKGLPLPQAVARRNARERNRVKQVNNGFAALRERIPEEVAECFEPPSNTRGVVKKLSKVETLRMAVEYIRSLERLLGFDFPIGVARTISASSADDSFALIKDEFDALSPSMDEPFDDTASNYDMDEYMPPASGQEDYAHSSFLEQQAQEAMQLDMLPNITTLNGLQYIRIPGTNTYQLLTPDLFSGNSNSPPNSSMEDEQFNALMDTNCLSPATSTATTADLHSSPPSIIAATTTTTTTTAMATAPAPATSGECVNAATSALSRSPVPPATAASPSASSSLHHQQQQQQQQQQASPQPAMLSPAINELLLQSCAADRLSNDRRFVAPTPPHQHLRQQRMIKQEYTHDVDFVSTAAPSPTATLIYQPSAQQQQMLLGHATLSAMSPPLDAYNSTALLRTAVPPSSVISAAALQVFYEQDLEQNGSFYESVDTFKKELSDVLLDTSANTATLSDESMIDAIDWWEAHTPKSDGGSVIL